MNTVTIKYTYGDAEITVQYANEDERKEALIEIKNLCKYFDGINQPAQEKVEMPEEPEPVYDTEMDDAPVYQYCPSVPLKKTKKPVLKFASEKQKAYMKKLGIEIPLGCTSEEARELIKQYKIEHGWKVEEE